MITHVRRKEGTDGVTARPSRRAALVEERYVPATIRGFQEQSEYSACQDELNVDAEASGAMPAAPVEELAAVRTQLREDVFEVRRGGGAGSERGWVERATTEGEQRQTEEAAADLEATIGDVLVRHPITGQMQRRTEGEGSEPRACQRTQRSTGCDMERDDHE